MVDRCRSQDRVIGLMFRPAEIAVSKPDFHVLEIQLFQSSSSTGRQRGKVLQCKHLPGHPCQHGGLIPRSGSDLQNHRLPVQLGQVGHECHDIGLGDCLMVSNGQGAVLISLVPVGERHETVARNLPHDPEDPGTGDSPHQDLFLYHALPEQAVG